MHAKGWIRKTHRISAAILGAFVATHLTNHIVGLWGVAAHQTFMDTARLAYRSPVMEPLLLAVVLVQIATGIAQVRAGWGERRGFWQRTQAISGLYLAFFLANHAFWVLAVRIGTGLDSNFYLAALTLTVSPLPILFAPYYALGVFAIFAHLACAVRYSARNAVGERIALASLGAGAVVAPVIVAVFMGAFYDIQLPPAYRATVEPYL